MSFKPGQTVKVLPQQLQLGTNAINMVEWEQQAVLSEKALSVLQQLEELQEDRKKAQGVSVNQSKKDEKDEGKILLNVSLGSKIQEQKVQPGGRQELAMVSEILAVNKENQQFLGILNEILESLGEIKKHFTKLETDKQQVVGKINEFYKESSQLIEEQKRLLELHQEIKSNLQYYQAVEEIDNHLDVIQKDPSNRTAYEDQLQRFLSEIIDGVAFFEAHPSFQQQSNLLQLYHKLKQRLVGFIKNYFFKIFNKEFAFINTQLSRNIFKNILPILKEYKNFLQFEMRSSNDLPNTVFHVLIENQPQYWRSMIGIGMYPQLKNCFGLEYHQQKLVEAGVKDLHIFELNEKVRHLVSFIEINGQNDIELDELYNNVFLKYMTYCRLNFHKELLENISSGLNSIGANGTQGLKKQDAFNCFCHFAFEQLFYESVYTAKVFNFSTLNNAEVIKSHWQSLFDLYFITARTLISWDSNSLQLQYQNNDLLSGYSQYCEDILKYLQTNCITYKLLFEDSQSPSHIATIAAFKDMSKNFFEKLRGELSSRLVAQSQLQIQDKIISFDVEAYCKSSSLSISRFGAGESQRKEIFPVVTNAIALFDCLKGRVEKSAFQNMVCDMVSSCLGTIYIVAEKFEEKFDAMIFVLKNTLILNQHIEGLGVDFTVKEKELDFSETKSFISDFQTGKLSHLYKGDNFKAENIWNTTTNIFRMIYRGMPKLKEFTVDLRNNMVNQLKQALDNLNKDMTFIIAKNFIDFIKRYNALKEALDLLKENAELQQPQLSRKVSYTQEDISKDLNSLIDVEVIGRYYHIFIQNLQELNEEMVAKMNNYLEKDLFDFLAKNVKEIIENCCELFSQFSIILSKHLSTKEYDSFAFPDPAILKNECLEKIKFVQLNQ